MSILDEPGYPSNACGLANFRRIRMERRLWVDKTRFLRALERVDHAVLIRPRRFDSVVAEKMREAADQVRRYLADGNLRRRHPSVRHVGLAVVFHGWEMAACEAVGDGPERGADLDA